MSPKISIFYCRSASDIRERVTRDLADRLYRLPASKNAKILLKPNLNSDMNALTGNTTDLRLVASVVGFLKKNGYKEIFVGDGTSSGFFRNQIDVIRRLRVRSLSEKLRIKTVDLNHSSSREIDFGDGFEAEVAEICLDCDFFINLPKLKTHFEVLMSACLKNLVGCLQGLEKQKVHDDLVRNIIKLNEKIKPDLHIVDGIIPMEGTGPSAGRPTFLGSIVTGEDPYLVDMMCAEMIGLDWREVPYLKLAENLGIIDQKKIQETRDIQILTRRELLRPEKNLLVAVAYHPQLRKYFTKIRLSPLGDLVFSSDYVSKLLLDLGLRQDVFLKQDSAIEDIYVDEEKCDRCLICKDICPMNLDTPNEIGKNTVDCIECLYCFFACPKKAIKIEGDLGFLSQQIKKYDEVTRIVIGASHRR